ncbi:TRAP transporter substrate-binding protein [Arthrobacter castelli]|uniref:TRAP transporter substrate-binding protein n=1 Tax=Arthrobacter castelli TaxID=271431 RepID=UPI00040D0BA2|nr:TRAP transporter substrate-binding protein [Arthrobacter castelli]
MSRKKNFSFLAAASALALTLTACGGGTGGNEAGGDSGGGDSGGGDSGGTMRLALNQTKEHPSYITLTDFSERLAKATDDRWDIKVYPNETLGAQQEALQLVSDGSVEMAIVSGTQLENLNPNFKVFNLPGVFKSIDHQMKVLNDEKIVGDLFSSLEDENITVLSGGFTQGARSVYNSKHPIKTPKDMNGLKFRVQESDIAQSMIRLMGGSPAPMAYGEVYSALQSGVIDGAENNEISYLTQKHNEVAKYFSYTEHLIGIDYLIINTDTLKSMSDADRKAFQQEWEQTVKDFTAMWKKETKEAHDKLKAEGVKFNQVDKAAFEKALAPIIDKNLDNKKQRELYEATKAAAE